MRKRLVAPLIVSATLLGCGEPRVTVRVTIQDESGQAMPAVDVLAAFTQQRGLEQVSARTNAKGQAKLTGRTAFAVAVGARKDGYYESVSHRIKPYDIQEGRRRYRDPDPVSLELRPIRNPIPMYARKFSDGLLVPKADTPLGFDLIEGDWVGPYGQGRTSDVLFTLSGFFTSGDEYDARLTLSFPNEGDGLIPFDAHPTSAYIAPYEAPVTGYQSAKQWRRSSAIVPGRFAGPGMPATERADEVSEQAHYVFRVRTRRNRDGKVVSGLYGKLYGDPRFTAPRDRPTGLTFTYYINPTPNDRNLECDWRKNLAPERRRGVVNPMRP